MDFDENLYDKIQAYLDKELSSAERKEFERAIAADENLAREVELHADMQELLSDTPENNLRKNLEKLSAEAIDVPEGDEGFDWRFLASVPIVLAIIGFLIFGRNDDIENKNIKETEPITSVEDSVSTIKTTIDTSAQTPKDTAVTNVIPPIEKKTKTEDKSKNIKKTTKKKKKEVKKKNSFEELPPFEALIANNARRSFEAAFRGFDITFMVRTDSGNSNGQSPIIAPFIFSGKFKTEEDPNTRNLKVHIFSNDGKRFKNFDMLYSNELILESEADGVYSFDFKTDYKLSPGLYYFLVEDTSTDEIYYANKFVVRQ